MISAKEILMGRDVQDPLSKDQIYNLFDLLPKVNLFRFEYGKSLSVSSGYRPAAANAKAGGSKTSSHMSCEAVDFKDADGSLAKWCLANLGILQKCSLYMEDPRWTPGWVHLQSRKASKRVFIPYDPAKTPATNPGIWDGKYDSKYDA